MIGTLSDLPFPEQMGTLNGASSRNLLLASPGGNVINLRALFQHAQKLVIEFIDNASAR